MYFPEVENIDKISRDYPRLQNQNFKDKSKKDMQSEINIKNIVCDMRLMNMNNQAKIPEM